MNSNKKLKVYMRSVIPATQLVFHSDKNPAKGCSICTPPRERNMNRCGVFFLVQMRRTAQLHSVRFVCYADLFFHRHFRSQQLSQTQTPAIQTRKHTSAALTLKIHTFSIDLFSSLCLRDKRQRGKKNKNMLSAYKNSLVLHDHSSLLVLVKQMPSRLKSSLFKLINIY